MKISSLLCFAIALCAGGVTLAYSFQQPVAEADVAPRIAWSRPLLVVDHGLQLRQALVGRGNQPTSAADLLVRFEPIPAATVVALHATYANLAYARPPLTSAAVFVDATSDNLPGRLVKAVALNDGTGAFEVRVQAPPGGWFHQPLHVMMWARSGDRVLYESDSALSLAP